MNLQNLKSYVLARLQESSTWRGLVIVATALGVSLKPDQQEGIIAAGLFLAGSIGAAFPDKK